MQDKNKIAIATNKKKNWKRNKCRWINIQQNFWTNSIVLLWIGIIYHVIEWQLFRAVDDGRVGES